LDSAFGLGRLHFTVAGITFIAIFIGPVTVPYVILFTLRHFPS